MRICHVSNSFIKVTSEDFSLVCDPWVGPGNHGGWRSYPEYDLGDVLAFVASCDHLYISHIHSDHFDENFIAVSGIKEKRCLIKKFANGVLKKRLNKLGFENIVELEPYQIFNISDRSTFSIIPQFCSNQAGHADQINYDLDTSMVVSDGCNVFFNQVDNPLSLENYRVIKTFIENNYGDIDAACFAVGAAGEYPQCFKHIDRQAERNRIIEVSLRSLSNKIEVMRPKFVFPAGGTYFIPGRFSVLNKFIAQPDFTQFAANAWSGSVPVHLEGGIELHVRTGALAAAIRPLKRTVQQSIDHHKGDGYDFDDLRVNVDIKKIESQSVLASLQYKRVLDSREIVGDWFITFHLYDVMSYDDDLVLGEDPIFDFSLLRGVGDYTIDVHLDWRAYWMCLSRKLVWNQVLSGSLCVFERAPNAHRPDVLFSLNHFAI